MTNSFYKFSVPIQIRMCDLDPFSHVNNGIQSHYFDYGRSCYFEHVLQEKIDWLKFDLVIVHLSFDFKQVIEYYDNIICETRVINIGNKSIKMQQQLRDIDNNFIKTECYSIMSGYDRLKQCSTEIQAKYRQNILLFESIS